MPLPSKTDRRITRRRFLTTTAGAAAAVPLLGVTRNVLGANEKLNIACIGVGGRGRNDLDGVNHENIVALCDIDTNNLGRAAKDYANAKTFQDYRKMFDAMSEKFDAVVIGTPDHHHAPPAMMALRAGKHVYCEKPLTHTVREAVMINEAAKQAKTATQMGTQIHAHENYRRVVELIQAGVIGDVTRVHTWVPTSYHGGDRPKVTVDPPKNIDWNLWLGPAPHRPYAPNVYHPFHWRGWWDFGGGALSDMACHHMDLPYWALGLGHPTSVEARGPELHPEAPPQWIIVDYHHPARTEKTAGDFGFLGDTSRFKGGPAVHLSWYHGGKRPPLIEQGKLPNWGGGNLFEGTKGMMLADYGRHEVYIDGKKVDDFNRPEAWIPRSAGHHREWTIAAKEGKPTTCHFGYASTLTTAVNLGNVAFRVGEKLEWDGEKHRVTNTRKADQYLDKEYRKGWAIESVV